MQRSQILLTLLATAAAATIAGCGDRTLTGAGSDAPPSEAPALARAPARGRTNARFVRCNPLPYDSVSHTVDRSGGIIRVGAHTLWVPPGAVRSSVVITAVAPSDTLSVVRFRPDGLVFGKPALLIMSYGHCVKREVHRAQIAYVTDAREIIEYVPSKNLRKNRRLVGTLQHFSNYAIAW